MGTDFIHRLELSGVHSVVVAERAEIVPWVGARCGPVPLGEERGVDVIEIEVSDHVADLGVCPPDGSELQFTSLTVEGVECDAESCGVEIVYGGLTNEVEVPTALTILGRGDLVAGAFHNESITRERLIRWLLDSKTVHGDGRLRQRSGIEDGEVEVEQVRDVTGEDNTG